MNGKKKGQQDNEIDAKEQQTAEPEASSDSVTDSSGLTVPRRPVGFLSKLILIAK